MAPPLVGVPKTVALHRAARAPGGTYRVLAVTHALKGSAHAAGADDDSRLHLRARRSCSHADGPAHLHTGGWSESGSEGDSAQGVQHGRELGAPADRRALF